MVDFLSLVIESVRLASHPVETSDPEYSLPNPGQLFGRGNWERERISVIHTGPASLDVHARLDQIVIMSTLHRAVLRRGQEQHRNRRSRRRWISRRVVATRRVTVDGGLQTGVDFNDRAAMHDWLSRRR
jgi:hypothetical protein